MELRSLAAALFVCAVLPGCGDDSDPSPVGPAATEGLGTTSPAEESSPAPTESANSNEKPLGPVQTVRAWVEAFNEVMATGDDAALMALSTSGCTNCQNYAEPFVDLADRGGRIESEGWRVSKIQKDSDWASNRRVVAAIDMAAGESYDSSDSTAEPFESDKRIASFGLVREGETWLVADFRLL